MEGNKFEGKQVGVCHSRKTFCLEIHTCPFGKVAGGPLGMLNLSSIPPLFSKGKQTHPFGVIYIYIYTHTYIFLRVRKIRPTSLGTGTAPKDKTRPLGDPLGLRSRGPGNMPGLSWRRPPGSRVMSRDLPPTSPAHQFFLFRDGSKRNSLPFPNAPQCQGVAWSWSPTRDTETPFYRCAQLRLRG